MSDNDFEIFDNKKSDQNKNDDQGIPSNDYLMDKGEDLTNESKTDAGISDEETITTKNEDHITKSSKKIVFIFSCICLAITVTVGLFLFYSKFKNEAPINVDSNNLPIAHEVDINNDLTKTVINRIDTDKTGATIALNVKQSSKSDNPNTNDLDSFNDDINLLKVDIISIKSDLTVLKKQMETLQGIVSGLKQNNSTSSITTHSISNEILSNYATKDFLSTEVTKLIDEASYVTQKELTEKINEFNKRLKKLGSQVTNILDKEILQAEYQDEILTHSKLMPLLNGNQFAGIRPFENINIAIFKNSAGYFPVVAGEKIGTLDVINIAGDRIDVRTPSGRIGVLTIK